jgi:predicted NBD/HSP70 family sugar kinase
MRVLGIDLGGSKLLACGLDDHDAIGLRIRIPTGYGFGPDQAVATVSELAAQAREALGGLDAIGIGFPGLVDHRRGLARSTTMLDGWHDVDLARRIAIATGVPCAVDNDVNTAAVCEQERRGAPDLLYVAVGTGIGGALILDGQVWRGAGGFAGEIGHVCVDRAGPMCGCGRRGCVNLYASGPAIELAAGLARGGLMHAGPAALPAVLDGATALGAAIGSALNLLDVPLVVLGGGVVELGAAYVAAVAASVRRECFREIADRCVVDASRIGYDAPAFGAAMLARRLFTAPAPHWAQRGTSRARAQRGRADRRSRTRAGAPRPGSRRARGTPARSSPRAGRSSRPRRAA